MTSNLSDNLKLHLAHAISRVEKTRIERLRLELAENAELMQARKEGLGVTAILDLLRERESAGEDGDALDVERIAKHYTTLLAIREKEYDLRRKRRLGEK